MGINSHGSAGNSHSHLGGFPFPPIPIHNAVFYSHSHGIHILIGNPIPMHISSSIEHHHVSRNQEMLRIKPKTNRHHQMRLSSSLHKNALDAGTLLKTSLSLTRLSESNTAPGKVWLPACCKCCHCWCGVPASYSNFDNKKLLRKSRLHMYIESLRFILRAGCMTSV